MSRLRGVAADLRLCGVAGTVSTGLLCRRHAIVVKNSAISYLTVQAKIYLRAQYARVLYGSYLLANYRF